MFHKLAALPEKVERGIHPAIFLLSLTGTMTLQTIQTARLVWKDLKTCPKELHLDTLKCGQSFRWRQTKDLW